MQKLEERNTYTPTDITQVSGNCDRILNREETLSVSGLKTANTLLISYFGGVRSSHDYKSGVSATPTPHGDL